MATEKTAPAKSDATAKAKRVPVNTTLPAEIHEKLVEIRFAGKYDKMTQLVCELITEGVEKRSV